MILPHNGTQHHLYPCDTQLYVYAPPTDHAYAIALMEVYVRNINVWLCNNGLLLNPIKTKDIAIKAVTMTLMAYSLQGSYDCVQRPL